MYDLNVFSLHSCAIFPPRPLFSKTIILNVHFIKFKFYLGKKKRSHGGGGGAGARHNCKRIKTWAEI